MDVGISCVGVGVWLSNWVSSEGGRMGVFVWVCPIVSGCVVVQMGIPQCRRGGGCVLECP